MEAELANERRQKDFLTAQLSQVESHGSQEKDQIIFRLEAQLKEHHALFEKYEHESTSKENVISQMRTKLTLVETELQKVRVDSKVLVASNVETREHLGLKRDLDTARGQIRELETSQEVLKEKKARLEQELGVMQEKLRYLENSERSHVLKLSELEETSKATNVEVAKVFD